MKHLGFIIICCLSICAAALADIVPPPAASQLEVNQGTITSKFVSPKTLAGYSLGAATNGQTAAQVSASITGSAIMQTNGTGTNSSLGSPTLLHGAYKNFYLTNGAYLRTNTIAPFDWEFHNTNGQVTFGTNTVTKILQKPNGDLTLPQVNGGTLTAQTANLSQNLLAGGAIIGSGGASIGGPITTGTNLNLADGVGNTWLIVSNTSGGSPLFGQSDWLVWDGSIGGVGDFVKVFHVDNDSVQIQGDLASMGTGGDINWHGNMTLTGGHFTGDGSGLTDLDGGNMQTDTINSNKFDAATRAMFGSGSGGGGGTSLSTNGLLGQVPVLNASSNFVTTNFDADLGWPFSKPIILIVGGDSIPFGLNVAHGWWYYWTNNFVPAGKVVLVDTNACVPGSQSTTILSRMRTEWAKYSTSNSFTVISAVWIGVNDCNAHAGWDQIYTNIDECGIEAHASNSLFAATCITPSTGMASSDRETLNTFNFSLINNTNRHWDYLLRPDLALLNSQPDSTLWFDDVHPTDLANSNHCAVSFDYTFRHAPGSTFNPNIYQSSHWVMGYGVDPNGYAASIVGQGQYPAIDSYRPGTTEFYAIPFGNSDGGTMDFHFNPFDSTHSAATLAMQYRGMTNVWFNRSINATNNIAPWAALATTGGETNWSFSTLYTNAPQRAVLSFDARIQEGSSTDSQIFVHYTNSGVGKLRQVYLTHGTDLEIHPTDVWLDPNATFQIDVINGTGGTTTLLNQQLTGQ